MKVSFSMRMNGLANERQMSFNSDKFYKQKYCAIPKGEFIKLNNKPFFAFLNENGTVKSFLDALNNNEQEAAYAYVSKKVMVELNYDELQNLFDGSLQYKHSVNCYFDKNLGGTVSNVTILKRDIEKSHTDIIQVKMIKEPDAYGKWKIYNIKKE